MVRPFRYLQCAGDDQQRASGVRRAGPQAGGLGVRKRGEHELHRSAELRPSPVKISI
jgi:hypothetical protein